MNTVGVYGYNSSLRSVQSCAGDLFAKMLYTRSCAVNSVVGHLLGIGDRHTHNILIHQNSGEVVHIDFGIVFEQGKVSQVFNLNAHQG